MNRNDVITRSFELKTRAAETQEENAEMWVEGYASVFDSPTVLFESGDIEYKEQVCTGAFDDCDMTDVIFNYNHSGRVYARTRNNTLQVTVDDKGLFVKARLDGTEEGQKLYHDIQGGYIDRMSFQFSIREEDYDSENYQWNIKSIKRLYDVSAVDIPAYDDTSIEARKNQINKVESAREQQVQLDKNLSVLELKLKI